MSAFSFLKSFGQVKVGGAVQSGIDALVRWDPKGASEAELIEMEKNLDQLGKRVVTAREALAQEATQFDQINGLFTQRLAAAQTLEAQLAAETDPTRQASLNRSIETLVAQLEKQKPELDQHAQDKASADDLVRQLQETYEGAATKLKTAREDLTRAARDIERAQIEKQRALESAEASRQALGLSKSAQGLTTALDAMHREAEQARQDADAARLKAESLRIAAPEQEDPNIAAAMAAISGKVAGPSSLSDRLAALSGGQSADGRQPASLPAPKS